ncbi:hypothetical protein I3271_03135 [Photobacterium leiognathi]|uniref:hypothetical protein n=1 Tax=Photobacterium leiognathi TaxID=553611 RepID=UPI001EDDE1C9|nr:hypothetical protein [Photobacterium leiognathi]MCG3883676.1 hypothetical protein [Photobacterium leiognathi]
MISQTDIAKEDVLNTNRFKILMKLSTEISNYKNNKKNIKHAFEQSEHYRHIAINILDSLNSVLLNSNWEPVKKDTLLAPIKKIISRSLLSKELRSLLELLSMESRLESHTAKDIIALLTLNELTEVFKNNIIPDHASDRGDIVITEWA